MKDQSRVILVGAGPGDPELLTMKADRALRSADAVLYDALANAELLERCRPSCKRIYVGKRRGNAAMSQDEINRLLLWHAKHHPLVVRLKGGDPLVFGRGHEEINYLNQYGINTEIIPGISSSLAAPALAGISVTQRGVNESFWVVTGTCADGSFSSDILHAAQSTATIVILMGMGKLAEIAELVARYRSPLEPIAIVEQASLPTQRQVFSTAHHVVADALAQGIGTPAVIVVGAVVEHALPFLQSTDRHLEHSTSTHRFEQVHRRI